MAGGGGHHAKSSKNTRKYGRNKQKCELYRARGIRERNKERRIAKQARKAARAKERRAQGDTRSQRRIERAREAMRKLS